MNAARNLQRRVERMDKVERPVLERRRIGLELHPHQRGGKRAAELREVGMDFGEHRVLDGVELTVMHGERVGVVGENGAGKSVMLKTLVGELMPTAGEVWVGRPSGSATWRRTRTRWIPIPRRSPPCAPASPAPRSRRWRG